MSMKVSKIFVASLLSTSFTKLASANNTVSDRYKAPNPETPRSQAQKWHQEDEALWKYVSEVVPAVLEHTGTAAFDGENNNDSGNDLFVSHAVLIDYVALTMP